MRTANIFHLVHRFGAKEDQISASFGFILQANPPALQALLDRLGLARVTNRELREIDIETQVPYSGIDSPTSRIDLQIRLPGRYLVFLESKLGSTPALLKQLNKYASQLTAARDEYDAIRLVLVTQFERASEAESLAQKLRARDGLKPAEFVYLRWEQILQLVANLPARPRMRMINELFIDYVGDMMSDRKVMKEQIIGKVQEVLVAATDPDWWDLAQKRHIAVQDNGTPDARWVAFYRIKPEAAITHIAEVEWTESNVNARELFRAFPRILAQGKKRGWIDKPQKVYHIKELVPLPIPIRRRGRAAYRVKAFKSMTALLSARYLEDLFKRSGDARTRGSSQAAVWTKDLSSYQPQAE
jgi:hypothetical protein